ncbi:uncharacterized protein AB675_10359 [Cyphellophora attinorum]|uniref:Uncharacterized protein n=1 Tax=Cyphellophora attinorum TaxID=1664694 RepID=A0A0N1H571_9EURO|nr:uncharacterized protein AB675_10359 [Phialophora attinorum]KPI37424.1 hypothetical protein AB675_10359 [Phialophora attinorum]
MATQQYYDKVSGDESDLDIDQPTEKPSIGKRFSWSQQSFIIRTLVIAIYTVLIAGICSAIVEYRHNDDASVAQPTSTAAPAAVAEPPVEQAKAEAEMPKVEVPETPTSDLDQIMHCGGNYTEARDLGCVYDVMMQLWMPKPCYDSVLSEKFLAKGNWTWWSDPENGVTMSDEQMRKGEHDVAFMLMDYHKMHCIFAMEKLVRALRNQWMIIPELVSYDHILHCKMKTLARPDGDVVKGVRAPTGFTSCAPYEVWKNQLPEDHASSVE